MLVFESRAGLVVWSDDWLDLFPNEIFELFVNGIGVDSDDKVEHDVSCELEKSVLLKRTL